MKNWVLSLMILGIVLSEAACSISQLIPDATITGCNFSNQDLQKINLTGATLTDINFNGSNLEGANFNNTVLNNVSFEGAEFQYINDSSINDPNSSAYHGSPQTLLKGATFNGINSARYVTFVAADLSNAQIKGSRFVDSVFFSVDLRGADLSPLHQGGQIIETELAENNIFFYIKTGFNYADNPVNVNLAHLPISFFLGMAGVYNGQPYFYFS